MACAYIVKSATHLPKKHNSHEIMSLLYKEGNVNKIASRFSASTGIDNRFISIELNRFPDKNILPGESPLQWLSLLYRTLLERREANFISLSYNISSHEDFVPTLSSQLCQETGLTKLVSPPEEFLFMGCASAIFSIDAANKHCIRHTDDIAFIATYEQSSWLFNPENERNSPDFKPSLRGHAWFGDGAAGLLVVGENLANEFEHKLRIIDTQLSFYPGNCIGIVNNG